MNKVVCYGIVTDSDGCSKMMRCSTGSFVKRKDYDRVYGAAEGLLNTLDVLRKTDISKHLVDFIERSMKDSIKILEEVDKSGETQC